MSNEEIWKDINGYEGFFMISNQGRVKSLDRVIEHTNHGLCLIKGKLRKLPISDKGYHKVGLNKDGKTKKFAVHRLVAQAFIPNPESKPQVNHIDGVKTNNNVSNLEWVTNYENAYHAIDMGLHNNKGAKNGNSKLNKEDVIAIKGKLNKEGNNIVELAKEYSVGYTAIYNILKGISWNHI
jgi:hypothetical protein